MCGICGAVGTIDNVIERAVRSMMDAQTHRGPDDSGVFVSDARPGVILGFRRLAILDLTADGHQPMVDAATGNAIVFNGEIYNFASLREDLQARGLSFRSSGDTEVLLKAYGHWGASALGRLRGMFGFAVYDRAHSSVLIARDRLGIKPIYLYEAKRPEGRVLLFASELRALLASGLTPRRLDPDGLATYMWNGFVVGPSTMVEGVSLLPPGAFLRIPIDSPTPRPERFWSLGHRPLRPVDEAVESLEFELITAMRQHMVSDVPLGVFLSGGVDSSAIASLAVRSATASVKTFNISFDDSKFDESQYARRVAQALGTEHFEFRLTQDRFRGQLDAAMDSLDQPTFDGINTYFVSRVVREAGLTVALAGTGGDELFGGYRSFRDLPKGMNVGRMSHSLPRKAISRGLAWILGAQARLSHGVPPQTRWGKVADLVAAGADLVKMYQVSYALYTRDFLDGLARRDLLSRAPFGLPPARASEIARSILEASDLSKVSLVELALFIGERLLRDSDVTSMAVSLELRVPFLDHAVVEAALAVPDEARFDPLGKKDILKRLAMPNVDRTIFDRPKSGFVLPIELWAKDQLAEDIGRLFSDSALTSAVGLSSDALQRLWSAFLAGQKGIYWSRIWAPYVLLRWCRRHDVTL